MICVPPLIRTIEPAPSFRNRYTIEQSLAHLAAGVPVMQLGFVSAILGDRTLEEVLAFASDEGFACVELMCWPPGKADRRYAGVTHLDVTNFTDETAAHVRDLVRIHGVRISGLGYYPNPLDPDPAHRQTVGEHLRRVIRAAPKVGVKV